ncbi:MAG: RecQ family zinc-binding domain-containing protein, partial [Bacteroidota bacterium]
SEGYHSPSKVLFNVDNKELYAFQVANPKYEPMIQLLLRMYGGELFNSFKKISEKMLAQKGQTDVKTIVNYLVQLDQRKVLHYEKQKEKPQITFLLPRSQVSELPIDLQKINARKERDLRKAKAVVHYAQHENRCRTQLLLEYFGEVSYEPCGVCDICLRKKKEKRLSENHYERYRERILKALAYKSLSIEALVKLINPQTKEALLEALQKIIDVGEVEYNDEGKLKKA